jgi:hypothetical protein
VTQLSLFDEAVRHDLEQARHEIAWLRERLDNAKVEYRKLREELGDARQERERALAVLAKTSVHLDQAVRDARNWRELYAGALRDAAHWQTMYALGGRSRGAGARGGVSREELTHLLTLAHPDKWSQGQLATELAHELSVAVNQLRAEVQG